MHTHDPLELIQQIDPSRFQEPQNPIDYINEQHRELTELRWLAGQAFVDRSTECDLCDRYPNSIANSVKWCGRCALGVYLLEGDIGHPEVWAQLGLSEPDTTAEAPGTDSAHDVQPATSSD
jgi:hypothetical protein